MLIFQRTYLVNPTTPVKHGHRHKILTIRVCYTVNSVSPSTVDGADMPTAGNTDTSMVDDAGTSTVDGADMPTAGNTDTSMVDDAGTSMVDDAGMSTADNASTLFMTLEFPV